jgi:predicted porin
MNKKLLAIAVGAAMVAGATAATAGDEPTFYAKIHMSIDSMDNGGTGDSADGLFVSSNSSRFGFKGAADLDGGLKAVYKYEISTDYTGGLSGNRNAYLGLKGGFGQIIAGRHDMPFKTVGRKHDFFGDTIGDNRAVTRLGSSNLKDVDPVTAGDQSSGDDWADRRSNVIMYTNKFGAVGFKLAYAPEETGKDNTDMGLGLDFKQGPLSVMFAYETHGEGNLDAFQTDVNNASGTLDESTGMMLAGKYKMGSATIAAGFGQVESLDGADGSDADIMTLGAAMKSGMNTFKIQCTNTEFDGGDASSITALGVDHKLGKKTSVYAVYAAVSNDDGIPLGFAGTGHSGTVSNVAGEDASGISLGMIHKF